MLNIEIKFQFYFLLKINILKYLNYYFVLLSEQNYCFSKNEVSEYHIASGVWGWTPEPDQT